MVQPIKYAPLKDQKLSTEYQTADGYFGATEQRAEEKAAAQKRQSDIAKTYAEIREENKVESLGIWQAARTPNSFGINAQQALNPFMNLKNKDHLTFFDIEAGGTPTHLRGKDGLDMFFMTELSFGGTRFEGKDFAKNRGKIMSMAVAPGQAEYDRLKENINRLKKNPLSNVSSDMHRTLLDLAKYSDVSKFVPQSLNGINYAELTGHSRLPAAGSAFTGETIKQVEAGLNNLFHKGTRSEDALRLLMQHVKKNNSKLAGFNIDHYDLPAILGITKSKNMKEFYKQASKNSLDFYHAYSAVEKDPYTLTGASNRQEHIHQYLINKKNSPIKNPKSSYMYHLASDDILANMEIAGFIQGRVGSHLAQVKNSPSDFAVSPFQINQSPMKADLMKGIDLSTELFAYQSGGFDPEKHKYNMVGRIGEDGKVAPRWDSLNTSAPANESFFVREFMKDVVLPGTDGIKGVGVRLDSKDIKDKALLFFAETEEKLAQQLHGSFMPVDSDAAREFRDIKVKHDAPFREYEKMFEYGGFKKMKDNYDFLDKVKANPEVDLVKLALDNGKSAEYAQKFPHMAKRLEEERSIWGKAIKEIGISTLTDEQKDFALQTIKKDLDTLGHNRTTINADGKHGKFFEFSFGGDDKAIFNARNSDSIKGAFRSHIAGRRRGDRAGEAEKSYKQARINELQELIVQNFGLKGEEAKKVEAIANGMKSEVHSSKKIETALTSMANFVRDRVETKGQSGFIREVTNEVTDIRRQAISTMTAKLPEVLQHSMGVAQSRVNAKDVFAKNSKLKTFVEQQDNYIKKLFSDNFGAHGISDQKAIEKAADKAAKYRSSVKEIVEKYSYDFHTEIKFTEEGKPLLVLADKKTGKALVGKKNTYKDLVMDSKIATIELPRLDDGLKVRHGSSQKASIMRSGMNEYGEYHSTSVTDALKMISDYSGKAKSKALLAEATGKKNLMVEIQQAINNRVSRQVDPVASNPNSKLKLDEKEQFEVKNRVGGETRGSKWDISGYAKNWYVNNARRLGLEDVSAVERRAKENHTSFAEAMSGKAKNLANSGSLLAFANEESGLKGSAFGINKLSGSKFYVGTGRTDARTYMALGHYNADSVENPHKTVNYRAVDADYAKRALEKAGKNQAYRTQNSFISNAAYDLSVQGGELEIRGIQMQSGYMDDSEIALKLRDSDKVREYKDIIDKAVKNETMTAKEGRAAKQALDMGMLSSSEGLGMMDPALMKAFDGMDQIRVNINADKVIFDSKIENAIEEAAKTQNLDGMKWKETGITFDKPIQINLNDLYDKDDKLTIGKYWNNEIESSIVQENTFVKGNKKGEGDVISILGFNADGVKSKSLVLGRERKTGHGFKGATEGGIRATYVPMPGEIMSDIYGVDGIEMITSGLESEKKGANELPALIRGYETQIRQQFENGAVSSQLSGYKGESQALAAYYKDVQDTLGIKTTDKNGQRLVDDNFGLDGQTLSYEKRNEFSKKWQGKLGLDREVFGDIVMAHDVWNRQGGKNRGKITPKEIDMLDRSMARSGIYMPGEESHLSKFWKDMVFGAETSGEIATQQKVFGEVLRAAGDYNQGWAPKAGDAVIDYTADGMGAVGSTNAQMSKGILEVSRDSFEVVKEKTGHHQTYTMSDYNKTIVNAGQMSFQTGELDKNGKPIENTIQRHLLKSKGTSYMKLPDFAAEQYIPLIDTNSMPIGGMDAADEEKYLDVLKGHYAKIDRKTNEYNNLFATNDAEKDLENLSVKDQSIATRRAELEVEINREVEGLKNTIAASTSSDGMANILSRRVPMSTQLQFGGVNPALAYHKSGDKWINSGVAKEGEVYINERDARNLIGDKAENIAKSWGVDVSKIDGDITDYVMKNWNEKNVYSTTVRYPSIDVGTSQAMKMKISDAVGEGQIVGLRGMAERISGDYDGDNLAVFLSHYGIDDDERRSAVLGDIKKLHDVDTKKNMLAAQVEMEEVEKDFKSKVATFKKVGVDSQEVADISDSFFSGKQLTLGDMHGQEAAAAIQSGLKDSTKYDNWGVVKNGEHGQSAAELEKSLLALGTAGTIGSVDNTRMRMSAAFSEVARVKYERFNGAEGKLAYSQNDYIRETSMVDEFLREYSQKAISAKKAEGSKATAGEIVQDLYSMIDNVNNPSKIADYDTVASDLVDRGLFKSRAPFVEAREGQIYSPDNTNAEFRGSKHDFIKKSLQMLGETEEVLKEAGFGGYRHSSLMMAASQGMGLEDFSRMVRTGDHIPGGAAISKVAEMAAAEGKEAMLESRDRVSNAFERIIKRKNDNVSTRFEESEMISDIMNQGKKGGSEILSNEAVPIHRTMRGGMNESLAELATAAKGTIKGPVGKMAGAAGAGFGGLWATTALMKGAPTPEGLQEMAPVPQETLGAPTARITPNQSGEYLNIQVNAKAAQRMNNNDIAAMLNNEIMAMSSMKMQTNVNVNDNSQNIDNKWMESVVANVMDKGYAYS